MDNGYSIIKDIRKRHKQSDKLTDVEVLCLEQYKILGVISEILVDNSKFNITDKDALEKIRDQLSILNY